MVGHAGWWPGIVVMVGDARGLFRCWLRESGKQAVRNAREQ